MFTLNCRGRLLIVDKPLVMGIINTTPDSFYEASRRQGVDEVLRTAEKMIGEGATILDVGGQSSRPGSEKISEETELQRVIESVRMLAEKFPETYISIDSFYSRVAAEAVGAGAVIVNDISGGAFDSAMWDTVAALKTPYVLMHIKGSPDRMQADPRYDNVTQEVLDYFIANMEILRKRGIQDIIVDPGFGFGKTPAHNFQLLRELATFQMLDAPLLIGVSRKSSIAKTLGVTTDETLNGTTVLNTISLVNGAAILRVHDVKEAVEAVKLWGEVYGSSRVP